LGKKKYWIYSPEAISKPTPSLSEKLHIESFFSPLIDKFKETYVLQNPDRSFNYCVDIYTKWHQNFFYLCQKLKSENPNRILDEFEVRFVRLQYLKPDNFSFAYYRHTGQWHVVADFLTLNECREMILSNPLFQPTD
jgi:hypothetical protein